MKNLVLVVDDDFDIRDSLMDVLEDLGRPGAAVEDGYVALEYLRTKPPPALILLDYMMPRCNGADFRAEQVKNERWMKIPTVLLSADPLAMERAKALGLEACLKKPVQLDAFIEVLERFP